MKLHKNIGDHVVTCYKCKAENRFNALYSLKNGYEAEHGDCHNCGQKLTIMIDKSKTDLSFECV
jgi:transcription elongation factor Elf1